MSSLMKIKPRVGWVRADQMAGESAAQEILKLRKKVDELNLHIAESELAAPPGTDDLSQGEETTSIRFKYLALSKDQLRVVTLSWNQILSILGPILIVQAKEGDLRAQLAEAVRNSLEATGAEVFYTSVVDEDFQKVKLQLRALGLVRELKDKSSNGGDSTVWTLTPYGDRLLTRVAAIRSSKAAKA